MGERGNGNEGQGLGMREKIWELGREGMGMRRGSGNEGEDLGKGLGMGVRVWEWVKWNEGLCLGMGIHMWEWETESGKWDQGW